MGRHGVRASSRFGSTAAATSTNGAAGATGRGDSLPDLYVSGGGRGLLWRFGWNARGGDLIRKEPLPVGNLIGREAPYIRPKTAKANAWIAGIAVNPDDGALYVLNNQRDTLLCAGSANGQSESNRENGRPSQRRCPFARPQTPVRDQSGQRVRVRIRDFHAGESWGYCGWAAASCAAVRYGRQTAVGGEFAAAIR